LAGAACIHDGDVLPLRPLLETTVEALPLRETRTRSPLVPVALQLRVVVQVFFPAAIWQGFGEALIEPETAGFGFRTVTLAVAVTDLTELVAVSV